MATLSNADKQNLTVDQQKQIAALKDQYAAATTQADKDAIHAQAEAIRNTAGYSGGVAGNENIALKATNTNANTNKTVYGSGGSNPYMSADPANGYAALGSADSALLNADMQAQIQALKDRWAAANAANDQAGMDAAHSAAEAIRQSAGYSAGADGTGYQRLGANAGGMTADDMAKWLADYQATNYREGTGWTNGYSTAMNVRSKANQIRQQMLANEQAMASADQTTKSYLHEQNLALAQLLYQYAGHTDKTTWYNEEKGRWETENPDVGYGYYVLSDSPTYADTWKKYMGYTDADIQKFANDTSYYYNFVDPTLNRLAIDESRGYTGIYSQFANGPYGQLLGGGTHDGSVNPSIYQDVYGDGFGNEGPLAKFTPIRDENGNVLNAELPALKNNNSLSDYTNQFTSYVQGGVIQPGILAARNPGARGTDAYGAYTHKTGGYVDASDPRYTGNINRDVAGSTAEDPNNLAGQLAYWETFKNSPLGIAQGASGSGSSGSSGVGGYGSYIEQMYAEALRAQLEQLKASYDQNISDLNAEKGTVDDTYTEQKRQTTGTSAQQAANWREMANAYGLNSGAIGQAALAQNNQLQNNLNTLESAQAAAQAEIERQRTLMGQQYQSAINQALAENNYQMAQALYQEAVRQDEMLVQQQQFNANLALQYAQLAQQQAQYDSDLALQYAKMGLTGSSGNSGGGSTRTAGTVQPRSSNEALYAKLYAAASLDDNPQNFIAANYKDYGFDSSSGLWPGYQDWAATNQSTADIINRLNKTTYQSADNTTANALAAQLKNDMSLTNEQKLNVAQMAYQNGHISSRQLTQMLDSLGL